MACGGIFGLWMVPLTAADVTPKMDLLNNQCRSFHSCKLMNSRKSFSCILFLTGTACTFWLEESTVSSATFRFMLLMLTVVFLPEAPPVETRMTVDMNTTFGKIISQEEYEEEDLGTTSISFL